jgi:diguanylate cyclase (GGDEF)-like protein/putative nucleotidyltransferase with HDIG domain
MMKIITTITLSGMNQVTSLEAWQNTLTNILLGLVVLLLISLLLLFISHRKLKIKNRQINYFNELRKAFIDANDNLIYLKDENLKYIFFNKSLECFYDRGYSQILGNQDSDISSDKEFVEMQRRTDLEVLEKKSILASEVSCKDRIFRVTKFPVRLENGKHGVGAEIEDVTKVYESNRLIEKNLRRNMILVDILSRNFDTIQDQLDYALNESLELTESKIGYIYLYKEENQELTLYSWSKDVMDECTMVDKQTRYQLENTGLWGEVVRQRKPIILNNYEQPNEMKKGYPEGHVPLYSFMSVPVILDGEIVAVAGFANKETDYDYNDVYQITALMNGVWHAKERREALEALDVERNRLEYLSFHDSLTGLYNRMFFEEELKRLDTESNLPISVIVGDMNGLKLVNDIFGHDAGDQLLNRMAEVLKKVCRADDVIARVGGDEFSILLPKTGNEQAKEIIQRVQDEFSKVKVEAIRGSISMGCDTKISAEQDLLQVLKNAEDLMYDAKTLDREKVKTDTVKTIIKTLHSKSSMQAEHSKNVAEICANIALAMNLPEDEINRVKAAGFLHDIGKITLKKSLLEKYDNFTEQEKAEFMQHPITGYRILNSFNDTLDLAEIILTHHEYWDGSGYPRGLKGEEIPKLARIIAIAESYQILTRELGSKSMTSNEAVNEIKKQAGKKFDPNIVDIFIKMMNSNDYVQRGHIHVLQTDKS